MPFGTEHILPLAGAYIGIYITNSIINYLMPTPPAPTPHSLTDFDAPTAEEGRPVPVVFGTVKLTGPNVLWYGGLYIEAIRERQGKK